jgi:hypothetical protein
MPGCRKKETTEVIDLGSHRIFTHRDFELLVPKNWSFMEDESKRETVIFRAHDGNAQLTISLMYYERTISKGEVEKMFKRYVDVRRKAETDLKPSPVLTDYTINTGDGYWYTKYRGHNKSTDQRSATLITTENGKMFTLYVEANRIDHDSLNSLATHIFSNFKVK